MDFETTSKPYGYNQTFDVSPPRVRKAKDKIALPEGDLGTIHKLCNDKTKMNHISLPKFFFTS